MNTYIYDLIVDGFGVNFNVLMIPFLIIGSFIYSIIKKGFRKPKNILEWWVTILMVIVLSYFIITPSLAYFQYLENRQLYSEGKFREIEGRIERYIVKGQLKEEFTVKGVLFEYSTQGGGYYYIRKSDNPYIQEGAYVKIRYLSTNNGIVRLEIIDQ